jgi:hypothetical protein
VLAAHGWEDLGKKLNIMSRRGKWDQMAREVPDEVVQAFSAVATYDELAAQIRTRFGGISDCVELGFPEGTEPGLVRELLQDIQAIESPCKGVITTWD